ncbi:MAG: type II toxin-antitoxin system YafQ family toxin [Bacteroidetes bacterium]|nr:type II toxin-antitoxin system YafQ family toxin [Bacteroidota bacterium]
MYTFEYTTAFKKDMKLAISQNRPMHEFETVVQLLAEGNCPADTKTTLLQAIEKRNGIYT